MTRRSRAREVALQLLVWRDQNPTATPEAIDRFVRDRLRDPTHEPFARRIYDGVLARQTEIDAAIVAAAENWRLPRMPVVDRNVLRIGVFELSDETDKLAPAVVINEAIEVARRYGSADSPSFVNGVLDQVKLQIEAGGLPIAEPPAVEQNEPPPSDDPNLNPQSAIENPQ